MVVYISIKVSQGFMDIYIYIYFWFGSLVSKFLWDVGGDRLLV